MHITEIIERNYPRLKARCHNDDRIISLARTSEDIVQDVCLTAIRKFRNQDIPEEVGLDYLERTLWFELKFQVARIDPRMDSVGDLTDIERNYDN